MDTNMEHTRADRATGRRQFVQDVTLGTVALSGVLGAGTVSGSDTDRDMLVIIYDDGHVEDYTEALPIHQAYDAPACVAACPGLIGSSDAWLTRDQLDALYDNGWEVMSHTIEHRALGEIPIESDVREGDTRVQVQSHRHGQFAGDPLLLFDDDTSVTVTVAGNETEDGAEYLLLEEPTEDDVLVDQDAWVRYTDEFTRHILEESRDQLESWGYPVTGYVHPYNRYDGYVSEVLPEYYDAVPNAGRAPSLIGTTAVDPFEIGRDTFETDRMSDDEIGSFLDRIVEDDVFGVLYGHTGYETMPPERIEHTLETADGRDVDVVTLQEALVEVGVFSEIPDPPENGTNGPGSDDTDDTSDDGSGADDSPTDDSSTDRDDGAKKESVSGQDDEEDSPLPGFGTAAGVAGVAGGLVYSWYTNERDGTDSSRQ